MMYKIEWEKFCFLPIIFNQIFQNFQFREPLYDLKLYILPSSLLQLISCKYYDTIRVSEKI